MSAERNLTKFAQHTKISNISKEHFNRQILADLRNLAYIVTKNKKVVVRWSDTDETASYEFKTHTITITDNCLPKSIRKKPRIWKKALDGLGLHEAGHEQLTTPIWTRYERFMNRVDKKWLAHRVQNIVEDKRVNRIMEAAYRYDFGMRLNLVRRLIKSSVEENLRKNKANWANGGFGEVIMGVLINFGLYEADLSEIVNKLPSEVQDDLNTLLGLLDKAKSIRVKQILVEIAQEMYNILNKYSISERGCLKFIHSHDGGEINDDIGGSLQKELDKIEEDEKAEESKKESIKEGCGAGGGSGDEISAPTPDYGVYYDLVRHNAVEIQKLRNKLKKFVKPKHSWKLFQKRGKIMPQIVTKAYIRSFIRPQHNIYQKQVVSYEKEPVTICINLDISGSMSESDARDCMTILNEVFGSWLEDKAYSILFFASDFMKIKTFSEFFDNTKARIGGTFDIARGTVASPSLAAIQRMFLATDQERQRILILVSDFDFFANDKPEAERICTNMANSGVKMLFINLHRYTNKVDDFCRNLKNVFRTTVKEISSLPDLFISIYEQATAFN